MPNNKSSVSHEKKKKKRKIPLAVKCILIIIILLGIALTLFFFYIKQQTNPYRIATKYAETFMSKDVSALFRVTGLKEDTFTTPETFRSYLQERLNYDKISAYNMVEFSNTDDENIKQYGITWQTNERNREYNQTLTLKKSAQKLYFFFDNWEIDTSEFLAQNCSLNAPAKAAVFIDNTEVPADTDSSQTTNLSVYKLGSLFPGRHTITVKMADFTDFSTTVNMESGDYSKQKIYTITPSMLKITAETEKTLIKDGENLIRDIYKYALAGKSFKKLADIYTFEDTSKQRLEQAYNALITNHIKPATHLTDVNFTSYNASTATTYAEDGCYAIKVSANVDYTANSVVVKESTAEGGGFRQSKSGPGSSFFTITFHYKKGIWSISDTTALDACIYYIKY